MGKWNFKQVTPALDGDPAHDTIAIVELSEAQQERISTYEKILTIAAESRVAHPPYSNYFVKSAIGLHGGPVYPGGNIEYGLMQALHSEECLVAVFRAMHGWDVDEKIIMGFSAKGKIGVPTCCGNCRDIMLDGLGRNLEIVEGNPDGGDALVVPFDVLLFDRPQACLPAGVILHRIQLAIDALGYHSRGGLVQDPYSPPDVHPERRYTVSIEAEHLRPFLGGIDGMCEYHPIYPIRDAVREARRANRPRFYGVIVVHDELLSKGPPHVMYKDRQHLLEMNLQAELLAGQEFDPPVYLVNHRNGEVTNVWRTSVKEWLPFPFTPRDFGAEFIAHLESYYRSK